MEKTQQSTWLISFGLMQIPDSNIPNTDIDRRGNCVVDDKTKTMRQLKDDIKEKIKQGVAGRINIYDALLAEKNIPLNDGKHMTIKAFGCHLLAVTRNIEKIKKPKDIYEIKAPKGQKAKRIIDLFEQGVSEADITQIHHFERSYVYCTLVKYGRVLKRTHSGSVKHGTAKLLKIDKLLKNGGFSIKDIALETGASIKYVRQLKLERSKAIDLINRGKSDNEICVLIKISAVYAEHLRKDQEMIKLQPTNTALEFA